MSNNESNLFHVEEGCENEWVCEPPPPNEWVCEPPVYTTDRPFVPRTTKPWTKPKPKPVWCNDNMISHCFLGLFYAHTLGRIAVGFWIVSLLSASLHTQAPSHSPFAHYTMMVVMIVDGVLFSGLSCLLPCHLISFPQTFLLNRVFTLFHIFADVFLVAILFHQHAYTPLPIVYGLWVSDCVVFCLSVPIMLAAPDPTNVDKS